MFCLEEPTDARLDTAATLCLLSGTPGGPSGPPMSFWKFRRSPAPELMSLWAVLSDGFGLPSGANSAHEGLTGLLAALDAAV